ncbi:MAG: hypothetical protein JEZ08_21715 [Clostridiales bacterium]|nr:hypothetical protein [Clostridiales bacterium]
MIKNNKGVITVKLIIMIVAIIAVFSVLLQALVLGFNNNHDLRSKKLFSDHILAGYDTYLFINYGLYGVTSIDTESRFQHSLAVRREWSANLSDDLGETDILSKQIQSFMMLRLPANYMDQVLSKLEVIKKAKKTQDSIELKTIVDTAVNDLGHIFDKRVQLSIEVNKLNHNLLESWEIDIENFIKSLNSLKLEYVTLESKVELLKQNQNRLHENLELASATEKIKIYEQILSMEMEIISANKMKKAVFDEGCLLMNHYNLIIDTLLSFEDLNEDLIDTLIRVAEKTYSTEKLIEETQLLILNEQDGIEVVKNLLIESLEESKISLYKDKLNDMELDEEFLSYMEAEDVSIDMRWYPVIQIPYRNMTLLKSFNQKLSHKEINAYLEGNHQIEIMDFTLLDTYQDVTEFPKKAIDSQKNSYYEEQKYIQDRTYEVTGKITIDRKLTYNDKQKGNFWSSALLDTGKMLSESVIINEYILSTFKSYANSSDSDFDYFTKYERASYFQKGEIEYILMGENSEGVNVMETTGIILGVRTVMNGIHIYTDKEKLALSESVGISVAGWTGFGAPLVSNVLRVCWATGESFYDVRQLIKGEGVPFYKIYPDQWYFDLGLIYEKKELPKYLSLMDLTYHDYLRFMLMTVSNETKLKRIVNIIELNLYQANRLFDLSQYYTKVIVLGGYERGYYD